MNLRPPLFVQFTCQKGHKLIEPHFGCRPTVRLPSCSLPFPKSSTGEFFIMEGSKHTGTEHVKHAIQETSPYTSSQNSQLNGNDIEKRPQTFNSDGSTLVREDDAVTAKTWAVVVVSFPNQPIYSKELICSPGSRGILRNLLLACPILQHNSIRNGH